MISRYEVEQHLRKRGLTGKVMASPDYGTMKNGEKLLARWHGKKHRPFSQDKKTSFLRKKFDISEEDLDDAYDGMVYDAMMEAGPSPMTADSLMVTETAIVNWLRCAINQYGNCIPEMMYLEDVLQTSKNLFSASFPHY